MSPCTSQRLASPAADHFTLHMDGANAELRQLYNPSKNLLQEPPAASQSCTTRTLPPSGRVSQLLQDSRLPTAASMELFSECPDMPHRPLAFLGMLLPGKARRIQACCLPALMTRRPTFDILAASRDGAPQELHNI